MEQNKLPVPASETGMAEIQNIFEKAPATLTANRDSNHKAIDAGNALLKNVQTVGMSDLMDEEISKFIDRGKKTISAMNERRKPFTQMMDAVKKEFTSLEGDLKEKIQELQTIRDEYAARKMEAKIKKEQEAARELARSREAATLRQEAENAISSGFIDYLSEAKRILMDKFNSANLDSMDDTIEEIKNFCEVLTPDTYKTFPVTLNPNYHTKDEAYEFQRAAMNHLYKGDKQTYQKEISALKKELCDKKASKIAELKQIAEADATTAQRLEEERKQREERERIKIQEQAQQAKDKAETVSASTASAELARAEINAAASLSGSEVDAKEGYQIIVKEPAAYVLIAQFWMLNEGKSLSPDKIEKVTFERMRKFCEKMALATGELIESPFIEYKPVYKAK